MRDELFDEFIHWLACFDHEHDAAGAFQKFDQLINRVGAEDFGPLSLFSQKIVNLGHGPVVGHDREAVVVHVKNKILAHDSQTNQSNVALRFHFGPFESEPEPYKTPEAAPEQF